MPAAAVEIDERVEVQPGEWAAMSEDGAKVLSHGADVWAVLRLAHERGEEHPVLTLAPHPHPDFMP